jgi:quercetin dioxygenase-like cupin family protein
MICADLNDAIDDLRSQGFRLDVIYPADDPHSAVLSRGSETRRLTTRPGSAAPSGELPPFVPEFLVTRGGQSGEGRAGMRYRDVIPGRLGGRYIASHIAIDDGGPVSDWVHFHRIAIQLIYVRRGWVRVIYEDQGEPFVMNAGDLVLQPPGIRHRVLESSPVLEVLEITAPALHETLADHDLALPNDRIDPHRLFGGQRFLRHVAADTPWTGFRGAEAQQTAMLEATGGLAEVRTLRPGSADEIEFAPHDGELIFGFVLEGSARLDFGEGHMLDPADAFVIPPNEAWRLSSVSPDFRLLQVATSRL